MKITKRRICLILLVFIFWGVSVRAQDNQGILNKQMRDALMMIYNADNEQLDKLKKEILAVYQSQGESGLRHFIKGKKKDITIPIIIIFIESGIKEKKVIAQDCRYPLGREKK